MEWEQIKTENRNSRTESIDALDTLEMVRLINEEDAKVALAIQSELVHVASAVDIIVGQMRKGGRLVYSGCGTSGRLGVLDAAECPPTYSTDPGQVIGLIAGGNCAMFCAVEGAEDNGALGAADLKEIHFSAADVLVGLAASGRTPYVLGALEYAKELGAHTIGITCCPGSPLALAAEVAITPEPGPEVVTGSTRMKSGTAQKMVLNMLSTCAMIKLGKVYGNLMVDVQPTNEKLIQRCKSIESQAAKVSIEVAEGALEQCDYRPKVAIAMLLCGVDAVEAKKLLEHCEGSIARVVSERAHKEERR